MLRRIEVGLWFVAILAIGIYVGSVAERAVSQAYLDWEFTHSLKPPLPAIPPDENIPYTAQPLGRIEIPSIGLSAMFIEGVDARALRRGVGHIPQTALPGMFGNVGLSAHRDTFFRNLGKVANGDLIRITTLEGIYEYTVESFGIVDPDERAVLRDVGRPTVTLVTCYPFYYVGFAPKRFVVHASLITGFE